MNEESFEISEVLKDFASFFAEESDNSDKVDSNFHSYPLITEILPFLFSKMSNLDANKYAFKGSMGNGRIANIPWIAVFDKEITKQATEGYYIVYLFREDMQGLYLSLNQGFTQYGINDRGRKEAKKNANKALELLRSTEGFSSNIDLQNKGNLAKGYEAGNICCKYYSIDSIPNDQVLIDDLRNLIGIYKELKGLIGTNIKDICSIVSEEEYQNSIQKKNELKLEDGPIERPDKNSNSTHSGPYWPRDPQISSKALTDANFICENDNCHKTFTSSKSGEQFMEAHHLIPMKYQYDFSYSIDVPENIICLCPNCHRAFHHSNIDYKAQLIEKFLDIKQEGLRDRGLETNIGKLIGFYNADQND